MTADTEGPWLLEFHGVVHPQSHGWRLDEPIPLTFPDGNWTVMLADSKFTVVVRGRLVEDFATFKNEVMSILRGILDALGFHLGVVLTPELHGVLALQAAGDVGAKVLPATAWHDVTGRDPAAPLVVGADELGPFIQAATSDLLIRHALSDLSMAIDRPDDTGFYAFRAVESARQYFRLANEVEDKDVPWSRLHAALGYTKDQLMPLTRAASARRHGDHRAISEAERLEVLTLAREVIRRLVNHHQTVAPGDVPSGP